MTIPARIDGQSIPDLPASHYLDNRIYTDPGIFALERDEIFARSWKFVCHASELRAPGDYRLVTVAGLFHDTLERIPVVGDRCHWHGWDIVVIDADKRGRIRVMASRLQAAPSKAQEARP